MDIESLDITPFSNVELKNVYIKDLSGDTALIAKQISAGIDLPALLKKEVIVTSVVLSDFDIHLSKENKSAPLNIQFIIDAFAPKKKETFADDKILGIQTYYEQQWIARGLNIKYIRFVCPIEQNWEEPDIEIEKDSYRSFGRNQAQSISNK